MSPDFYKRQVNLLDENQPASPSAVGQTRALADSDHAEPARPKTRKRSSKKRLSLFFVILIIIFSVITSILAADNNSFFSGVKNSYIVRQIINIVNPGEKYLAGEKEDRINFLLMGMGGPGHQGPLLTDTMVIASFQPSTKRAALFSIPRDMIAPLGSGDYRKINSIYSVGEDRGEGQGGLLAKEVVGRTFDIPIHYYAALDFNGFVEVIDAIGGVKVDVEKSFTDNQFPTEDYKYQEISFKAGSQKMDGLTALRFARSRHGNNGEGSDFARIKRQQKIIMAAKDKLTSFNTLINPQRITSLYNLFNKYTKTDLEPWEAVKLIHLAKSLDTQKIITQSIDDRPGNYLKAGITAEGAFILQPISGNYQNIQMLIKNIFNIQDLASENAKIVVQNGTKSPGLALQAVNHLNQVGYNVLRYGNSTEQDKLSTVIYNYNDKKPKTLASLEAIFQTKAEGKVPLEYSSPVVSQKWDIRDEHGNYLDLDFLIILGADQDIMPDTEIIKTIDPSLLGATSSTSTINIIGN
ncbi:MAG: hypothetical protein C3F02_03855 [Parcubacteria group bacterium]|nr:MAG: hypothetical protein C3F02_03855 [Parcubacteria group bacterium]